MVHTEMACFQRICREKSRKLHTGNPLLSWTEQLNCIMNYMNKHDVIRKNQHRFCCEKSCFITDCLRETRIAGKLPNILYEDFQRTFRNFLTKDLSLTGKVLSQINGQIKAGKQIMRTNNVKCY